MTIVISGRVKIREDATQDAVKRAGEMARASRAEDGCADYRFGFDVEDSTVVLIAEHWESQDALDAHMKMPHFQEFMGWVAGIVDGPVALTQHEVSGSKPLFG